MELLWSEFSFFLFSFSIFSDRRLLKIEKENNSMKALMQTLDHRRLIYGTIGTPNRVLVNHGKRAIRVRAMEVLSFVSA